MFKNYRIFHISLLFVITISFFWFVKYFNLQHNSLFINNGQGFGLSLESYIQELSFTHFQFIFNFFYMLCFPALGFIISYNIFLKFLNPIWSVFLALVFFSNVYDIPLHEFLISWDQIFYKANEKSLIKYCTLSVIIGLLCVYLILSPRFLYKDKNYILLPLVIILVFLNSLDAAAVSIAYCVISIFKIKNNRKILNKEIFFISILVIFWLLNFYLGTIPFETVSDAKNTLRYTTLYFLLPLIFTSIAFFLLKVDIYQIFRRFAGLVIVMISEIIIVLLHYLEIFKFSILELQFLSIYNIFHILYYIPFISWICNNRILVTKYNKFMNNIIVVMDKSVKFLIPIMGIVITVIYNVKLIF